MNRDGSLLVLDLASYGSALAIINQFCDDQQVKVFEVSPVGAAAILILLIQEKTAAQLLKNEVFSYYKASVLSCALLEDFEPIILSTYLSQNKPDVLSGLLTQEFSFVSEAFKAAHLLLSEKVALVDFRVIRTQPLNVILISTANAVDLLSRVSQKISARSTTIIDRVEPSLRSYFQIVK